MRAFLMLLGLGVTVAIQATTPASSSAFQSVGTVLVVTTSKGQPVPDLVPAQLAAEVDGQPAGIEDMQAVGRALAVVLMLDVSGSMFSAYRGVGQGLGRHVPATLRADDVVRFGAVGGQVAVGGIAPHTREYFADPPALIRRPDSAQSVARPLMTSPLWDAVAAAVAAIRSDDRHRLIVFVTDGMVAGSRLGLDDAIRLAADAQTAVSVVDMHWANPEGVKQDNQKARAEFRPDESLRRLAASTGGGYFAEERARTGVLRNDSDMPELVAKAIAESRGAYRISLRIPADGAPHSIKFTSSRSGLVIRTPPTVQR